MTLPSVLGGPPLKFQLSDGPVHNPGALVYTIKGLQPGLASLGILPPSSTGRGLKAPESKQASYSSRQTLHDAPILVPGHVSACIHAKVVNPPGSDRHGFLFQTSRPVARLLCIAVTRLAAGSSQWGDCAGKVQDPVSCQSCQHSLDVSD